MIDYTLKISNGKSNVFSMNSPSPPSIEAPFITWGLHMYFQIDYGNNLCFNFLPLNNYEYLSITFNHIARLEKTIVEESAPYQISAATYIKYLDLIVGILSTNGEFIVFRRNDLNHPFHTKIRTGQIGVFHVLFSEQSKSIITVGQDIRVWNFEYLHPEVKFLSNESEIIITLRTVIETSPDSSMLNAPSFDYRREQFILPSDRGFRKITLDGKFIEYASKLPASYRTAVEYVPSDNSIVTADPVEGICHWLVGGQLSSRFHFTQDSISSIRCVNSEFFIYLDVKLNLYVFDILTSNVFHMMTLPEKPIAMILYEALGAKLAFCFRTKLVVYSIVLPWNLWANSIPKPIKIKKCVQAYSASRIIVQNGTGLISLVSPRTKETLTSASLIALHPIASFFYDRHCSSTNNNKSNSEIDLSSSNEFKNSTHEISSILVGEDNNTLTLSNIDLTNISLSEFKMNHNINCSDFIKNSFCSDDIDSSNLIKSDQLFILLKNGIVVLFGTGTIPCKKLAEVDLNAQTIFNLTFRDKFYYGVGTMSGDLLLCDEKTLEVEKRIVIFKIPLVGAFFDPVYGTVLMLYESFIVRYDLESSLVIDKVFIPAGNIMEMSHNFLVIGYENGSMNFISIKKDSLFIHNKEGKRFHTDVITGISFTSNFFVSASIDCTVKVWSYDGSNISTITLPFPLYGVEILNGRRDLIVGTGKDIIVIEGYNIFNEDLEPKDKVYDNYNQLKDHLSEQTSISIVDPEIRKQILESTSVLGHYVPPVPESPEPEVNECNVFENMTPFIQHPKRKVEDLDESAKNKIFHEMLSLTNDDKPAKSAFVFRETAPNPSIESKQQESKDTSNNSDSDNKEPENVVSPNENDIKNDIPSNRKKRSKKFQLSTHKGLQDWISSESPKPKRKRKKKQLENDSPRKTESDNSVKNNFEEEVKESFLSIEPLPEPEPEPEIEIYFNPLCKSPNTSEAYSSSRPTRPSRTRNPNSPFYILSDKEEPPKMNVTEEKNQEPNSANNYRISSPREIPKKKISSNNPNNKSPKENQHKKIPKEKSSIPTKQNTKSNKPKNDNQENNPKKRRMSKTGKKPIGKNPNHTGKKNKKISEKNPGNLEETCNHGMDSQNVENKISDESISEEGNPEVIIDINNEIVNYHPSSNDDNEFESYTSEMQYQNDISSNMFRNTSDSSFILNDTRKRLHNNDDAFSSMSSRPISRKDEGAPSSMSNPRRSYNNKQSISDESSNADDEYTQMTDDDFDGVFPRNKSQVPQENIKTSSVQHSIVAPPNLKKNLTSPRKNKIHQNNIQQSQKYSPYKSERKHEATPKPKKNLPCSPSSPRHHNNVKNKSNTPDVNYSKFKDYCQAIDNDDQRSLDSFDQETIDNRHLIKTCYQPPHSFSPQPLRRKKPLKLSEKTLDNTNYSILNNEDGNWFSYTKNKVNIRNERKRSRTPPLKKTYEMPSPSFILDVDTIMRRVEEGDLSLLPLLERIYSEGFPFSAMTRSQVINNNDSHNTHTIHRTKKLRSNRYYDNELYEKNKTNKSRQYFMLEFLNMKEIFAFPPEFMKTDFSNLGKGSSSSLLLNERIFNNRLSNDTSDIFTTNSNLVMINDDSDDYNIRRRNIIRNDNDNVFLTPPKKSGVFRPHKSLSKKHHINEDNHYQIQYGVASPRKLHSLQNSPNCDIDDEDSFNKSVLIKRLVKPRVTLTRRHGGKRKASHILYK
ncbi:hypothetical protein TRFO_02684 [Tritrichomonas foetus]|uniref:Uncharacterized protein n=1 Tax=Tritrichomonas foetus TaxID=1144522 RepID=A0A1J4L377_9EUKA|nr:hypothetical protein TRFO_02684 [Tritrichomonas foetus]|eukprot:OHT16428.1 hypothetical protein TRFO_02684 [Tritrichomonas foetus]